MEHIMNSIIPYLVFFLAAGAAAEKQAHEKPTIAVLQWENYSDETYEDFVKGIPEMIMTNLGRSRNLNVIERIQIRKALAHFSAEASGILSEYEAQRIGTWLGADYILLGSFACINSAVRLDARVIQAGTGIVSTAESSAGRKEDVLGLVDQLCRKILIRLSPGYAPSKKKTRGRIKIVYKIYFSIMTSRPLYHQRCKVFIDNVPLKMSPVIKEPNIKHVLLDSNITTGNHVIKIVHHYVDKEGNPRHEMESQPEPFFVNINENKINELIYRCKVGVDSDKFENTGKSKVIQIF
jgi:TolB-like protein